jgi:hypothetical protein
MTPQPSPRLVGLVGHKNPMRIVTVNGRILLPGKHNDYHWNSEDDIPVFNDAPLLVRPCDIVQVLDLERQKRWAFVVDEDRTALIEISQESLEDDPALWPNNMP